MSQASPIETVLALYPEIPFQKLLGIAIVKANPGENEAVVRLPFKAQLTGGGQAYHGGVISSLIDLTGALAAWMGHDPAKGMKASTVNLNVNFIAAALGRDIKAVAQVRKRGKELNFVDVEVVTDDVEEKLIATGSMVYRIA